MGYMMQIAVIVRVPFCTLRDMSTEHYATSLGTQTVAGLATLRRLKEHWPPSRLAVCLH
jgi:hypothetical protein